MVAYLEVIMLTQSEVRRWASLMLQECLRSNLSNEFIHKQVNLLTTNHGDSAAKMMLEAVLVEAGHIGKLHSNGELYKETLSVEVLVP